MSRALKTIRDKVASFGGRRIFTEVSVRVRYLHSDIETLERIKILRDLRRGEFDIQRPIESGGMAVAAVNRETADDDAGGGDFRTEPEVGHEDADGFDQEDRAEREAA